MTIWGNHSATQYPDVFHAEVGGKPATEVVGDRGLAGEGVHPHRAAAGRGHHRGAGFVERGLGGQRRHRPRPRLDARHARRRLGVHGDPVRRLLRRARGADLVVPGHHRSAVATASWRASTSTSSPGPASTPRSPSWARSATPSRASACWAEAGGNRPGPVSGADGGRSHHAEAVQVVELAFDGGLPGRQVASK